MVFLISTLEEYFSFLDKIEPNTLFYTLIIFTWIVSLWEHYLSYRQYQNYKRHRTVPPELADVMTDEELKKARSYAIDKMRYNEIRSIFNEVETTTLLLIGVLPWLWKKSGHILANYNYNYHEILQSIIFISIVMIYSTLSSIPWSYYYHFVLEEKHGFNKQTTIFFIKDTIKKLLVTLVLTLPIASLLIKIIQIGGDYFFVYAWLFITIMSLVIAFIYPNYIAPLFDRYDPLREGQLRSSIEALAAKINFPLAKIYVVEGSARSAHSNAYFYGFFKAKRIVLYDTLIKGYSLHENTDNKDKEKVTDESTEKTSIEDNTLPNHQTTTDESKDQTTTKKKADKGCESEEVLAVLCHEFGHWSLNHNLINLSISFINLFLVFAIFAALFKRSVLYQAFGFTKSQPILMGLLIIFQYVLSPYFELFSFALTALSRHFEFQADGFAVKLNHGEPLKRALKKLEIDNMAYPFSDFLYAKYHYSHPTLLERLKAVDTMKQN
jgi:STE24 endopeptidase